MKRPWDRSQRARLARDLAASRPLTCPVCGAGVARSPVTPPAHVGYVRRRVLLVCGGCNRSAALDLPREPNG